jgi:hypothetical protein
VHSLQASEITRSYIRVKRTGVEAKRLDRAAFFIREKLAGESIFHLAIPGQL